MGIQAISGNSTAIDLAALAQAKLTSATRVANHASQPAEPKVGGAPPPGGGGGGPKPAAASGGSTSSSSSTKKIYDKEDKNQDGVVSQQEELLYSIAHPSEDDKTKNQPTVSTNQMKTALTAYQQQQGEPVNTTTMSSLLFAA